VECGNATRNKCAERHGRGKARKVSAVGGWVSGFSGSKKTRCLPWFVTPRWEAVRVAEPWVLNGARTSAPQHGGSFEPRRREGDSMSRRTGLRTEGLQEARCVEERKISSRWFWILAKAFILGCSDSVRRWEGRKGKTSRRGALVPLLGTSLPCHTAMSFQNRSRGATWRRLHQSRRFRRMCHKRSFQKCRTFDINKCRLQTACETWGVAPSRHTSRRAWHARSWRPITMGRSAQREHAVAEASFGRYLKPVRPRFVQIKTHRRRVEHKCSMPSATESRVKRGPAIPQT